MPGPRGVSRADIVALLREGHSDRYIGRALRTNPKRVGQIRAELNLPREERRQGLTLEQKWTALTRPTEGGHLAWLGGRRDGSTPVFMHDGHNHMARRVAFRMANGREPEGRVLAGCGWRDCVHPKHVEDARMRAQYQAIFGTTGAAA